MVLPFTSDPDFGAMPDIGLAGRLLIAMPHLPAGPFARAVVLIARHDQRHAMGFILNKPIVGLTAEDAVMDVRLSPAMTGRRAPVFYGGPCETGRGAVLHSVEYQSPATVRIGRHFALTRTRHALERLHGDRLRPRTSRLIAGHAGWAPGQLDEELRQNTWLDLPASPDLVFRTPPAEMWETALEGLGITESSLWAMGTDEGAGSRPLN